jgi:hypothetical protein
MGSSFTVVDSNVQESSVTRGQMFMDQVSLGNFCYRDKKKRQGSNVQGSSIRTSVRMGKVWNFIIVAKKGFCIRQIYLYS